MLFDDQIVRKKDAYPWVNKFIEAMWDNPWSVKKFNFSSDLHDFRVNLTEAEKGITVRALSAIAQIEVAVKTFWGKLGDNLPPLRDLGYVMANVETVHNFAYEKLLEVLGLEAVFEKNLKEPVIAGRVNYLRKYTHRFYSDSKKQYLYALILFTLFVENVSLFSQFYIVNKLSRDKNVLKTVNQQILYTKNEELLHALSGMAIIAELRREYPELFDDELEARIMHESGQCVEHEIEIIKWILGEGASEEDIAVASEFVRNRMNASLEGVGYKPIYKIDPLLRKKFWWFEEEILATNAVDFFNQHSVNYVKNSQSFEEDDLF